MLVAACDDQIEVCNLVSEYLMRMGEEINVTFECDKYLSGEELLKTNYDKYKIIFLDIDMEKMNGMDVAEIIRKHNHTVEIVFLTGLIQYAVEGYRVAAYRFFVKPLMYGEFVYQMKDLAVKIACLENAYIAVSSNGRTYSVSIADIYYIEVINHTIIYHCTKGKLRNSGSLARLQEQLRYNDFVRIHNSYLVNMNQIAEVTNTTVLLNDGTRLAISRTRIEEFNQRYAEFWSEKLG